jgi:citrate lyase subunit beta/citryl-CoA lyase
MPERRLRRSMLMTPANRADRLARALACDADAFVFDLEDGVPPAEKPAARDNMAHALRTLDFGGRERCVRINGQGTPYFAEDLAAIPWTQVDSIMLPKVEGVSTLLELLARLSGAGADEDRASPIELIVMLETPRGILNALAIADATPRTTALFFGSGDYTSATGGAITDSALHYPRSVVAAAAAAAGMQAIDAAFFAAVKDAEATRRDALVARELGFAGKVVFHPNQVLVANQTFSPSADEIRRAQLVVDGYRQALMQGHGTSVNQGVFIAVDLVAPAERVLALAAQIEARRRAV